MGPIEKVYGKIKHFCLPTGTKHDLDVWMTGIRVAKVCMCMYVAMFIINVGEVLNLYEYSTHNTLHVNFCSLVRSW